MLVLLVLVVLVINGVIAHVIGNVGKEKKIGYSTSFWVSFLLGPLIGILMVIASIPLTDKDKKENITKSKKNNDDLNHALLYILFILFCSSLMVIYKFS